MGDITTHQRAELRRRARVWLDALPRQERDGEEAQIIGEVGPLLDALDERERRIAYLESRLHRIADGQGFHDASGAMRAAEAALAKEEG